VSTGVNSPCTAGTCGYVPEAQFKAFGVESHPFQVQAIEASARASQCISPLQEDRSFTASSKPPTLLVNYPALTDGASCFNASPCLLFFNPKEGRGGIGRSSTAGTSDGTHPDLFRRTKEALRSRSKVKLQYGQWNTRSSKLKFWLIPPQRKHSREEL